ncbi:MAG: glycine cleavage T C-terminal barrel domain-containing protein, partial [Halobaculum sp.]
YVGQEVVSKVENRGRPSEQLVGLLPAAVPDREAAVFAGDSAVGEVTRAVHSPTLDEPIALAYVDFGTEDDDLTVRVDGEEVATDLVELPFVEGSSRSARIPAYPTEE